MKLVYILIETNSNLYSNCCYSQVRKKCRIRGVFSSKKEAQRALLEVSKELQLYDKRFLDIVPVRLDTVVDIDVEELETALVD